MLSCPICKDGIQDNPKDSNYPWVLSCGHVYHKQCIEESRKVKNQCPQCRQAVTESFRLYPAVVSPDETITFLYDAIQSAEQQFDRQKTICLEKDTFIRGLERALGVAEKENNELRTVNVNFAKSVITQTAKLHADVKRLQDEKKGLNGVLNKSAKKVARHESTISELQTQLYDTENALTAKIEAENQLHQQIKQLKEQLTLLKQEGWSQDRLRLDEITGLRARAAGLQDRLDRAEEQVEELSEREAMPRARQQDPAVDALMNDFQKIELPSYLPLLRKRKNVAENSYSLTGNAVKSLKQLRGDSTAEPGGGSQEYLAEPSTSSQPDSVVGEPVKTSYKKVPARRILTLRGRRNATQTEDGQTED